MKTGELFRNDAGTVYGDCYIVHFYFRLSRDRKSDDEHQHENVNDHNDGGNKNTVAFIFEFGAMLLSRISYSGDSDSFHFQCPFKYLTSLESFVTLSSL